MPEMKTFTANGVTYEIVDEVARAELLNKAPAGHGLGTSGQIANDWNSTILSGFYYGKTNSPDGGWWCGAVYGNGTNYAFQHLYKSATKLQKVREYSDGTWSDWIDCSPTAFAPAGFGLGEAPPIIADANDVTLPGFYSLNGVACANIPSEWQFLYGTIIVSTGASFIEQLFLAREIMAKRTYTSSDGWGEWEYINPPMVEGVEYRTTERYNGQTVYTKLLNLGDVSTTGVTSFELGDVGLDSVQIIREAGTVSNHVIPYGKPGDEWFSYSSISNTYLALYTNGFTSDWKHRVWYIKP